MKIYSVYDPEFKPYGQIVEGLANTIQEILLVRRRLPRGRCGIRAGIQTSAGAVRHGGDQRALLRRDARGAGLVNGHNTTPELSGIPPTANSIWVRRISVLLLARQEEIEDGVLDTEKVKAFRVPAGVLVEVYATTLHYAPCHLTKLGASAMVACPWGTQHGKFSVMQGANQ